MEQDNSQSNRRRYPRFGTDLKLTFQTAYDLKTKVDFRVKESITQNFSIEKFSGESRNINVEGICIVSEKELKKGQYLYLEVYVPSAVDPIPMIGEVRWCQKIKAGTTETGRYETGVLVKIVEETDVKSTIFFDKVHEIDWSIVLEKVFSNFKNLAQYRKNSPPS